MDAALEKQKAKNKALREQIEARKQHLKELASRSNKGALAVMRSQLGGLCTASSKTLTSTFRRQERAALALAPEVGAAAG